jgi:D-glycero-D-manno-heptose 1,7-bisphosphate phosphatase
MSRPAAFVDRDGTINAQPPEHDYVTSEAGFVWLPGAVDGLVRLASAGYVLTVVSNQRGVARGMVTTELLTQIEQRIQTELGGYGCEIAAFRYCVHDHDARCDCRKPKPGLILQLADELGLDLVRSWMIGDSASDVQAGKAAGCMTALVSSSSTGAEADMVAGSLAAAADLIAARTLAQDADSSRASKPSISAR